MNRYTACLATLILRLFLCGIGLVTGYIGLFEPRSLISVMASTQQGYWLLLALTFFCLIGFIDAILNDVLPKHFFFIATHKWRHVGFCGIAFCYVAQLVVPIADASSPGLTAYYLWNACAVVAVAFVDANQRSKDATCQLLCV